MLAELFVAFCWYLVTSAPATSAGVGFTRTVNMKNSGPAGYESPNRAITWKNTRYTVHYYRFVKFSQTWYHAQDVCQSSMFSNRPGGCYLMFPDDQEETAVIDSYLELPDYSSSVWVNMVTRDGLLFDGRTNRSVYYPNKAQVEFKTRPDATAPDDAVMQTQIAGSWFDFQDWPSSYQANFFCECEDVCQPGVYACNDACCESQREVCSVVDDYTASCFCAQSA